MAGSRKTLSAQVDSDSELADEFEEYRENMAMNSKSEAVRNLVRTGIDHEFNRLENQSPDRLTEFIAEIAGTFASFAIASGILTAVGVFEYGSGLWVSGLMLLVAVLASLALYLRENGVPGT